MIRTPRQDLERELQDPEYVKLYGAEEAKAEFAVILARARRRSGMTQTELAERLGLSQPYIAKLERGDANPTLGTAGTLLAVLGFSLAMDIMPLLSQSIEMPHAFGGIMEIDSNNVDIVLDGRGTSQKEKRASGMAD